MSNNFKNITSPDFNPFEYKSLNAEQLNAPSGLEVSTESPTLTGLPTAPTALQDTATDQIATTAFVEQSISNIAGGQGTQGIKGVTGDQGKRGIKGVTGDKGIKGEKGDLGEKGEFGDQGSKGEKGDSGGNAPKGEIGDQGPKGEQGNRGEKGDTGSQGAKGLKGDTGSQGAKGLKGDTGNQGTKGIAGDKGETGDAGADATDGKHGRAPQIGENGNWFQFDDTLQKFVDTNVRAGFVDEVKIPVVISAEMDGIPLANYPLTIQAQEGELQTEVLDSNGMFTGILLPAMKYGVNILPKSYVDSFFSTYKEIITGTLSLALQVLIKIKNSEILLEKWRKIQDTIAKNANKETTFSMSYFGSFSVSYTDYKWISSILAPNGFIYGIPSRDSRILKINTAERTATTFGNVGTGESKWSGGVLASNGKIYGIPYSSTSVLEIDPETDTVAFFDHNVGAKTYCQSGVLGPNNKIYEIPSDYFQIIEIDPEIQTIRTFGNVGSGSARWCSGVLAPNGKIYGIPCRSTFVLEIDPETQTFSTFESEVNECLSGTLAQNGMIYGIPSGSSPRLHLEIDYENRTTLGFGLTQGHYHYGNATLASNGKIYGTLHYNGSAIQGEFLEVDPIKKTINTYPTPLKNCGGGTLGLNGKIYCVPTVSAVIIEINLGTELENFPEDVLLSPFLNNF